MRNRFLMIISIVIVVAGLACGPLADQLTLLTPTPNAEQAALATALANEQQAPTLPPTILPVTPRPVDPFQAGPTAPIQAEEPGTPQSWNVDSVRLYPGPEIYTGDVITIEMHISNPKPDMNAGGVTLSVNGNPLDADFFILNSPWEEAYLVAQDVWDTSGLSGEHDIRIDLPGLTEEAPPETIAFAVTINPETAPETARETRWLTRQTACCTFYYLSSSAAERDIELIAEAAASSIEEVEDKLGIRITRLPIPITLIDQVWGNGGYASSNGGIVVTYVDRNYNGVDFDRLMTHEITHWASYSFAGNPPTILVEGLAVAVAGGHYKPEPLHERAGALVDLDRYVPLETLAADFRGQTHEVGYVESGALVTYLAETYGMDTVLEIYGMEQGASDDAEWLDTAFQQTLDLTLLQVESDFREWLSTSSPGTQLDDLDITLALYATYRDYQRRHAPFQFSLPSASTSSESNDIAEFMREPGSALNVALELLFLSAHDALRTENYEAARLYLDALNRAIYDGDLSGILARDFLPITTLQSTEDGYLVDLSIGDASAWGTVVIDNYILNERVYQLTESGWVIGQ